MTRRILERGDYFELATLGERKRGYELEAQLAAAQYKQRIGECQQRMTALLTRLGLDPAADLSLEDADCSVVMMGESR